MDQLGTILRAVCLGLCVCGVGIGVLAAIVMSIVGGGFITTIKDILGIAQRDEEELIDETMDAIQNKRQALRNRRSRIVGDQGIPDFDAAVARYANEDDSSSDDYSAQSLDKPKLDSFGSGQRFNDIKRGSLRKRSDRDDEYEIYDDADFFDDA